MTYENASVTALKNIAKQKITAIRLCGGVYSPQLGLFEDIWGLELRTELKECFSICFDYYSFDVNSENDDDNGHYFGLTIKRINKFSENSYPIDTSSTPHISELSVWHECVYSNDEHESAKSTKSLYMMLSDKLEIQIVQDQQIHHFNLYLNWVPDLRTGKDYLKSPKALNDCTSDNLL
jgi:hypothetical protein